MRERSNPILNEIFMRCSIGEVASKIGCSERSISKWKYVPRIYISSISEMSGISENRILCNTKYYNDTLSPLRSKSFATPSADFSEASEGSMNARMRLDFVKAFEKFMNAKKFKSPQVRQALDYIDDIIAFVEETPRVWNAYVDYRISEIEEQRAFWRD